MVLLPPARPLHLNSLMSTQAARRTLQTQMGAKVDRHNMAHLSSSSVRRSSSAHCGTCAFHSAGSAPSPSCSNHRLEMETSRPTEVQECPTRKQQEGYWGSRRTVVQLLKSAAVSAVPAASRHFRSMRPHNPRSPQRPRGRPQTGCASSCRPQPRCWRARCPHSCTWREMCVGEGELSHARTNRCIRTRLEQSSVLHDVGAGCSSQACGQQTAPFVRLPCSPAAHPGAVRQPDIKTRTLCIEQFRFISAHPLDTRAQYNAFTRAPGRAQDGACTSQRGMRGRGACAQSGHARVASVHNMTAIKIG